MPFDNANTNPRATAAPAIAPTLIKMVRERFLFRGRQGRTCRPRRSEAGGGRSLSGGGAYRLLISVLLRLRKRLCSARLGCGVLSVLRPCGAGTVWQGLNRGLGCRRWRRAVQLLPVATDQGSSAAVREAPLRYWRRITASTSEAATRRAAIPRKPSRGRVARDHTGLPINLMSFSDGRPAPAQAVFFILRLWTVSAGPSVAAGPREEPARSQTFP